MPIQEISIEEVLCKTKDRKSSKKCSKKDTCKVVECCISDCNPDCCTAAFQRLDKLRTQWLLVQNGLQIIQTDSSGVPFVFNRAGNPVLVVGPSESQLQSLEAQAYGFVNTVRYLNFEECGKLDQVIGWTVDIATGSLYLYQDLPDIGLSKNLDRSSLLNISSNQNTINDKKQLAEFEAFWKLSLKAIERVRENPKTEGNICEIKDKCGNRFLVAINRTNSQPNEQSVCDYNSRFSIVAVKLCKIH
jgi:hypothetical protein